MALNDQILDELKKALNKVQATTTARQTWQEQFDRQPSVSPESIQAAKAIEGFVGSWAAQANLVEIGTELLMYPQSAGVNEPRLVTSHLGRPGLPESNFPLYSWGTNKDSEPAFLGHPISFSIVGPTVRHKTNNWQWIYSVIGSTEFLTLDTVSYDGSSLTVATIEDVFGVATVPDGGLYFVVSQTGAAAEIDVGGAPVAGGVGDGIVNTVGGRVAISELANRASRYEIFRVYGIAGNALVLEPTKRFSDYFNIPAGPATPVLRSITMFKPFVARLASIPSDAGAGKNKVFLAVTPERSANGDLLPPYGNLATPLTATWVGGNFADYDAILTGTSTTYGGEAKIPVFTPKGSGTGRLQTNRYLTAGGLPFEPGVLKITDHSGSTVVAGDVVQVRKVSQFNPDYGVLWTVYSALDFSSQGFYEVLGVAGSTLTCKALPQVDTKGNIFYGPQVFNASIDLDGVPVAATAGIQIVGAPDASATNYSITLANPRNNTSNTYNYAAAAGDTAQVIGTVLTNAINAAPDFNVTAVLNIAGAPNNVTIELTAITAGVVGNAISITLSPDGSQLPQMRKSGKALGTTVGQTSGYAGTITPVIGHGIGVNLFRADLEYTVHDAVSSLWQGQFDAAKVQANRLPNLIDPSWNKQALSTLQSVVKSPVAVAAARADKAIFDTTVGAKGAANPGSLLDLGFRMVLYPAKNIGGDAVPDFDRPLTTQNVILDPAVNESQYLYIDYASGAVVCSHTPDPTTPRCTLAPNGIVGTGGNNPRGDIVLFASFVPFSRQPQQTSGGLRVVTTEQVPFPYANTYVEAELGSQDVLGARTNLELVGNFNGVNQTLQSQTLQSVYLTKIDLTTPASTQPYGDTITVTGPLAGDSLTFNISSTAYTVTLTAGVDFAIGGTDAATATNLTTAINTDNRLRQVIYAIRSSNLVNIYTHEVGGQTTASALFPFAPPILLPFKVTTSAVARLVLLGGGATTPLLSGGSGSTLPNSGWFDVIEASTYEPALKVTDGSSTVRRVATFWYEGKEQVRDPVGGAIRTVLRNVFGGAQLANDIALSSKQYYASFRKADVLPNDLSGNTGTPFQIDTTEGSSARFNTLKFAQGVLTYTNASVLLDFSGDFVKKRGDTMSGALTISIDATLNPASANQDGLVATGNGTGNGVSGVSGASGNYGVYGEGGLGSNAGGVFGLGAGNGNGGNFIGGATSLNAVYANSAFGSNGNGLTAVADGTGKGVQGVGGTSGAGVYGFGARGLLGASNSIANYPQARLEADGTALPLAANRLKGDLWVPNNPGVEWDGHLLVYDGSNYLDPCAKILIPHHYPATSGGLGGLSSMTDGIEASATTASSFANYTISGSLPDLPVDTGANISSSTAANPIVITTATNHNLAVGDYVCIVGHTIGGIPVLNGIWPVTATPLATTFSIPYDNSAGAAGGATGTATQSFPYAMPQRRLHSTVNGASGFFGQTIVLPPTFAGLQTGAAAAITIYHSCSAAGVAGAPPTNGYLVYLYKIRRSDYTAWKRYQAVTPTAYPATARRLVTTTISEANLTANLGTLQAGDVIVIQVGALNVANTQTMSYFDIVFDYYEIRHDSY